jgi:predicted dehydrogenase
LLGEPREVVALCSSAASGFETDDTVGVDMRLDNNALVSLLVTRRTPVSTNEFDIFGTEGRIYVSSLVDGKMTLYRKGHDPEPMQFTRAGVMHSELVAEMVARLLKGEPSPLPGEEAVAVWRVMQAAYRSAEQGVQVKI